MSELVSYMLPLVGQGAMNFTHLFGESIFQPCTIRLGIDLILVGERSIFISKHMGLAIRHHIISGMTLCIKTALISMVTKVNLRLSMPLVVLINTIVA
jgi:hypothetical protein